MFQLYHFIKNSMGLKKNIPRIKTIKKSHAIDLKGTQQILFWIWWFNRCVCVRCSVVYDSQLCDPVDCSPPGSSVHGILQARILEWVAISFSRGSFWLKDQTQVSCIAGRFFSIWAIQLGFCLNRKVVPDQLGLTGLLPRNLDHQQNKSVFPDRGFLSFLFCCLIYREWKCSPLGLSVSVSLDDP